MSVLAEGSCGIVILFISCFTAGVCHAKDLAPRAHVIIPIHSNAITLTYPFLDSDSYLRGNDPNYAGYPPASVVLGHEEKARVLPLRN